MAVLISNTRSGPSRYARWERVESPVGVNLCLTAAVALRLNKGLVTLICIGPACPSINSLQLSACSYSCSGRYAPAVSPSASGGLVSFEIFYCFNSLIYFGMLDPYLPHHLQILLPLSSLTVTWYKNPLVCRLLLAVFQIPTLILNYLRM